MKLLVSVCLLSALISCRSWKKPEPDTKAPPAPTETPSAGTPPPAPTPAPTPPATPPAASDAAADDAASSEPATPASTSEQPQASEDPYAGNANIGPVSSIQALSESAQLRLMAAASAAAYCGDGTGCDVMDQFREASRSVGNAFDLDGWSIAFLSARDLVLDVEGYVFYRHDTSDVIIAFRGSESDLSQGAFNDWVNVNGNAAGKYYKGPKVAGTVHMGLLEAMYGVWHPNDTGLIKVIDDAKLKGKTFWLTGHSQGAAIAVLVAMRLFEDDQSVQGVYALGMPRIAAGDFQESYDKALGSVTQLIVNQNDPIPHLPPQFKPVGTTMQLWPSGATRLGRDGVDPWDIIAAAAFGNAAHHSLMDRQQGYFSDL